jgi:hypothetical protein
VKINWKKQWEIRNLWAWLAFKAMRKGPRRFWRWLTVDVPWILKEDP